MYSGKHAAQGKTSASTTRSSSRKRGKLAAPALLALLLVVFTIGGTLAFLISNTAPVTNTFTPSKVSCEVTESFVGNVKTNVNVKNTGDIDAYLRVRLVTYRVDGADNHRIGGTATIPEFSPGSGWVEKDGYYYYTTPIAPNEQPAADLINSITLQQYDDADGGRQVIEVMAEAIQSEPVRAVEEAWNVDIYSSGN